MGDRCTVWPPDRCWRDAAANWASQPNASHPPDRKGYRPRRLSTGVRSEEGQTRLPLERAG